MNETQKSLCPDCKGELSAAFVEHVQYPVFDVGEGGLDADWEKGHAYDATLVHITCEACDTYWYSIKEYLDDCEAAENEVQDEEGKAI